MLTLPGWTTTVNEVSNNVYKVTMKDAYGRIAEATAVPLEEATAQVTGWAFDIEKQISRNWGRFLFDLCLQEVGGRVVHATCDIDAVCSWILELSDKRVEYDGVTSSIVVREKNSSGWETVFMVAKEELTYAAFMALIKEEI